MANLVKHFVSVRGFFSDFTTEASTLGPVVRKYVIGLRNNGLVEEGSSAGGGDTRPEVEAGVEAPSLPIPLDWTGVFAPLLTLAEACDKAIIWDPRVDFVQSDGEEIQKYNEEGVPMRDTSGEQVGEGDERSIRTVVPAKAKRGFEKLECED